MIRRGRKGRRNLHEQGRNGRKKGLVHELGLRQPGGRLSSFRGSDLYSDEDFVCAEEVEDEVGDENYAVDSSDTAVEVEQASVLKNVLHPFCHVTHENLVSQIA